MEKSMEKFAVTDSPEHFTHTQSLLWFNYGSHLIYKLLIENVCLSQKTRSIFEAVWFHFETVTEFSSVLSALQLHSSKLSSGTKIAYPCCVFIWIKNWGSCRVVVRAPEVCMPLYFTSLYLAQMYIPQLLKSEVQLNRSYWWAHSTRSISAC